MIMYQPCVARLCIVKYHNPLVSPVNIIGDIALIVMYELRVNDSRDLVFKVKSIAYFVQRFGYYIKRYIFWHVQDVSVNCVKDCVEVFSKYSKETKNSILCEPFLETTRVINNLSKNFLIHLL